MTKGIVIHLEKYGKVSRRNSYTVCYIGKNNKKKYGFIQFYLKSTRKCVNTTFYNQDCNCTVPIYIAVLRKVKLNDQILNNIVNPPQKIPHLIPIEISNLFDVCLCSNISELCIHLHGTKTNLHFIAHFPNLIENDEKLMLGWTKAGRFNTSLNICDGAFLQK